MKVAVLGSGGREHALVWKLSQSPRIKDLFCVPGNPGIAQLAKCVPLSLDDHQSLILWAKNEEISLSVVGPEDPLSNGIVDSFQAAGLKIYGPNQKAAQLESSKTFAKQIMQLHGVPTAKSASFTELGSALRYVEENCAPIVIKADGLAAGKGVTVATSIGEAEVALRASLEKKRFGKAGSTVLIEEFLDGEEMTLLSFVSGPDYLTMVPSQDHKPVFDGDLGPNTGGMGAYSPVPHLEKWLPEIEKTIIDPMVKGLQQEGIDFQGILYTGLMITKDGPKVVEFNVRFGDPEAQVILPRLQNDLLEIMEASIAGGLSSIKLTWKQDACVCVIAASGGYPGDYKTGVPISGLKSGANDMVFHAGTKIVGTNLVTNGGRVLNVSSLGESLTQARTRAYERLQNIHFEKMHYRTDIASKAI
ncbi:MAG: phosphoribosylamine--glycine ligase [bacterium]